MKQPLKILAFLVTAGNIQPSHIRKYVAMVPLLMLLLSTCSSPSNGDTATISISFGMDNTDKSVVSIDQLRHDITLTGPTGKQTLTVSGAGTARATVLAGTWRIDVDGFYGQDHYSTGSTTAEVKAGRSSNVTVYMTVVWSPPGGGGGGGGGGGVGGDPNALKGTVALTGNNWERAILTADISNLTNLKGSTINYVWMADGVEISPTPPNTPTYQVDAAERGKSITVEVSTDRNSNTVTSNAVAIRPDVSVHNQASLSDIRLNKSGVYILTGDVNLSNPLDPFDPIGGSADFSPGAFTGTLDGNGYTITINPGTILMDAGCAGIFFGIGPGGVVKNLMLAGNMTISELSSCYVGALSAGINNGSIINVSSTANVSVTGTDSTWVGGIVGSVDDTSVIKNCYNTGNVTVNVSNFNEGFAGGIAGRNNGTVSSCWVSGNISTTGTGTYIPSSDGPDTIRAGGIVGSYYVSAGAVQIQNCVALNNTIDAFNYASLQVAQQGRITARLGGSLSNNHAIPMTINGGTVSSGAQNDKNGANFPSSAVKSDWENPSGLDWTVHDDPDDASESSPWVWDDRGGSPTQDRPVLWFEMP